jgi:hypothetical protein
MAVGTEHQQLEGGFEVIVRRAVRVVVLLLALCNVVGCGFSKDKKEAEQLAEQYFSKMRGGDVGGVLPLYSARFYEETSRADWLAILESQRTRCGTPKSHKLISWNVFSSFGTNSGVRTTLVYDVQYSSCRMSEKMTIFKPSGGEIQIQGHLLTPKPGQQDDKRESQATLST